MPTSEPIGVSEHLHTSYNPDCDYVDGLVMERNRANAVPGICVIPGQEEHTSGIPRVSIVDPRTRKDYHRTPESMTETAIFRTENPELVVPLDAVFEF